MKKSVIIIIVIIVIILIILISYIIFKSIKFNNNIENYINMENNIPQYADINDPYFRPYILKDLLTKDECKQIIDYAQNKLTDSEVISGKNLDVRNSKQCWIKKNSPLVNQLFNKVSKMFNIPVENAEDLQVVRYLPGEYFKEHHDGCCDNNVKCQEFINKSGQRILTVLIYLNNEFEEGYTYFPKLNLKLKTEPGNAIVFFPTASNSTKCHPLALHAGMPVKSGIKWICNLWFHEKKYS